MTSERKIKPYDITNGERVSYGYYSALEVIFQQFINKLEVFIYDEFKLSFSFNYKISSGIRFNKYLESMNQPAPLFIFSLQPLVSDSIFRTDNRFINLILLKNTLIKEGKVTLDNSFSLENTNSKTVKAVMDQLFILFESSWAKVHRIECKLKRVVSNKIKAKVMDNTESCVVVSIEMKQNRFVSHWDFCFSTYLLDRIIEKRGAKGLLAASGHHRGQEKKVKEYFEKLLLEESRYQIDAVLGFINLSSKDLWDSYQNKTVIPIKNVVQGHAEVQLNKNPILAAEIGETAGQISLKVADSFSIMASVIKKSKKSFSKLTFKKNS
jgi:flagellar motor switch protein FliM